MFDIRIHEEAELVSLHEILQMIEYQKLELYTKYPVDLKKTIQQKTHIIESRMLGIPCHTLWLEENTYGKKTIFSGAEMLLALYEFINGKFSLKGLRYLKDLENSQYNDLDYKNKEYLYDSIFEIRSIAYDSDLLLKCLLFRDINYKKLGRHTDQAARAFAFNYAETLLTYHFEELFNNGSKSQMKEILSLQEDILLLILLMIINDSDLIKFNICKTDTVIIALDKIMLSIQFRSKSILDKIQEVIYYIQAIQFTTKNSNKKYGVINSSYSKYKIKDISDDGSNPQYIFDLVIDKLSFSIKKERIINDITVDELSKRIFS